MKHYLTSKACMCLKRILAGSNGVWMVYGLTH